MRREAQSRNRFRRGFTLVELIVVAVIIGVVGTLAVRVVASSATRYRATGAAQRIAADLERARTRAKTVNSSQTVIFDGAGLSYQISGMANPDSPKTTYTVDLSADPFRATGLTVNFGGLSQVSFDRFGIPSVGGGLVVRVGSEQATVAVAAGTGRVTVNE